MEPQSFEEQFERYVRENIYAESWAGFLDFEEGRNSVSELVKNREEFLGRWLVDWIRPVFDPSGCDMLEIGCGTGSATAVLASVCRSITCFEIEERFRLAAEYRAELMSWTHVNFEKGAFGRMSDFFTSGRRVDAVLFSGVLEHMEFDVFRDVLSCAYEVLKPGGILIVISTPNRLAVVDSHTSGLPFFQWLPERIRREYYKNSPREMLKFAWQRCEALAPYKLPNMIQEWGVGLSYHDFELALGKEIHSAIVADGWEEHFIKSHGRSPDDDLLLDMWERWQIGAHRAFAKAWLNFIIKKPS
jgi:2-polyprenyl-3-methyl-5-hydroxy-6-metoxy-1,4-benzoquinol methylase